MHAIDERYGVPRRVTFRELGELVAGCATKLAHLSPRSVVALYASNGVDSVVVALAALALGLTVTTIPPDFGPDAFLERVGQLRPAVLFASRRVFYNGRFHDQMAKVGQILAGLGDSCLVLYPDDIPPLLPSTTPNSPQLRYRMVPFDHPMYVLYSSGTTGKPKCIVHSVGGTLVQHLKEHRLHGDVRPGDVVFQYTSIGWMMWHWALSVLGCGAALVLFDGSPLRPDAHKLWATLMDLRVTHFGSSAKYYLSLPPDFRLGHSFSTLRMLFSTGSPLPADTFQFLYERVKRDMIVASITGGTDILSLFCGGCPLLPVHAGEIQCRCLGMAVDDLDGDLVCRQPFPCMPLCFANDDAQSSMYKAAYFARHPGLWTHGDFVRINARTGGVVMLGRSDCTLNPRGIRFGSVDLYHALLDLPFVQDALAVPLKRADLDEDVILFVKLLAPYRALEAGSNPEIDSVEKTIKAVIRERLSPRHVPARVVIAPDIPYTANGKKIELAIRRIVNGQRDLFVECANPDCLQFYRDFS
jgi:acetoacetyl-CoA synthetase